MKRLAVLFAGLLAATTLVAAPATAAPSRTAFCFPESLKLIGTKDSICLQVSTPSIDPPFAAVRESNGSQSAWCLYTQPGYLGAFVRLPAFSSANFIATIGSARTC